MRLRRSSDTPNSATEPAGRAWDGVPSRPAAPPKIRAPRAADLATAKKAA